MLARSPSEINLGDVVRKTEPGFRIVECFEPETNTCGIVSDCRLRGALSEALQAFFRTLDRYTLADLVSEKRVRRAVADVPLESLIGKA